MSHAARIFRYSIPGGLFQIVVALWPGIDWLQRDDASFLHGTGGVASVVLAALIAAAFPLGFLITNLSYTPGIRHMFKSVDDKSLVDGAGVPVRFIDGDGIETDHAAIAMFLVDRAAADPTSSVVGERALAWRDLRETLRDAVLALLFSGVVVGVSGVRMGGSTVVLAAYEIMLFLVGVALWFGHRRVTGLYDQYRRLLVANATNSKNSTKEQMTSPPQGGLVCRLVETEESVPPATRVTVPTYAVS